MNAEERAKRDAAIIAAYGNGERLKVIGDRYGISESAVSHLVRRSGQPRRERTASPPPPPDPAIQRRRGARAARNQAILASVAAGIPYAEIANEHGVSLPLISMLARQAGVTRRSTPMRGPRPPAERRRMHAAIRALRAEGMSYEAIANKLGISIGTAHRVVQGRASEPPPILTASTSPHADAISWAIICGENVDTIASRYDVDRKSVLHRAKYLRKHGWSCPLSSKPCAVCGAPLLTRKQTGYQTMHPACKRRRDNERLAGQGAEWLREAQARTTATAYATRRPWTEDEDAYLVSHQAEAAEQLAADLGRSIYSINTRIHRLAKQGLIDTHARRSARAKVRGFTGKP